ncbi:hypothetical protein Mp_1g13580 [Marchantia polymorpha subsp. ruderalis]|nr:hypothetical protein MARPO_0019s0128 [Marchantia polymorpha]BBM98441.1 hypothetical protein Mp_1g13580 [Marchantia polymorpha subsp. ruderalis]|eukprot:PTQ44711.1 hypothetical protein MARPO_0019s0128 [Marchantia polymorpha]
MDGSPSSIATSPVGSPVRPRYVLDPDNLKHFMQSTPFTEQEIINLHKRFHELSRDGLDRILHDELIQVEQMRANPFASRICELFSEDGSGVLTFENFLNMMAVFSFHTRPEVKMVWAFAMWDFDGDDVIGPGDVRYGLNLITCSGVALNPSLKMLTRVPSAAGLEDHELDGIVREVVKEVDPDGYGLGYHEFRAVLSRMPDFINNFRMSF